MNKLLIVGLIILVLIAPMFLAKWCHYNTELLIKHYDKDIDVPIWVFMVGCYLTQGGLPYGVITEVWCQTKEIK